MTDQGADDDAIVAKPLNEVPMIDFSGFIGGTQARRREIAAEITKACETIGFFYLANHGVPPQLRANLFQRAKEFFHLPPEQKQQSQATQEWNRGWVNSANTGDKMNAQSRSFEQYRIQREFDPDDPDLKTGNPLFQPNRWPAQVEGFDRDCLAYYDAMAELGRALVQAMAIGLDLPEDRFENFFRKPICQISLMYYPPLPSGVGNEIKNLSAHVDEGPVVILAQDETGGLELKNLDGEWLSAPPAPGAYTINIGNMMMWWSNGRFKSTMHRVRNTSSVERISAPFFWNADPDVIVEPLPELVARDGGVAKYPPIPVGDLMSRFYRAPVYIPYEGASQSLTAQGPAT